jgi:signal transduction histidine kinase
VKTLADNQGNAEIGSRVAKIQSAMARYSQRVTMLLELASLDARAYPVNPREILLNDTVRAVIDSASHEARGRRIEVQLLPCDDCTATTDPMLVEQIVENLLLNAFKHSQASRVTVAIREDATHAFIDVADNGRGISETDQERIFGKFLVARDTARGSGTGLGLWIVRRLLSELGGSISLRSALGEGATFTVKIPKEMT